MSWDKLDDQRDTGDTAFNEFVTMASVCMNGKSKL